MAGVLASFIALGIAGLAAGTLMAFSNNGNAAALGAIVLILTVLVFITGFLFL